MFARLTLCCVVALTLAGCNREATEMSGNASADSGAASFNMTVYKTPQCGCCGDWVEHMKKHGFNVEVVDKQDLSAVKDRLGVPQELRSCHTATVGDHVFEGHVPAPVVRRFLEGDNEHILGLAVPGMPVGSPGMEMGDRFQSYTVVGFNESSATHIHERIESPGDQR